MAKVDLFPDFKALLELLNSAGVRYLVLGGYAVNHYGYHRATDDLDIWIAIDPENAKRVSEVLQEFGDFPAAAVKPSMFQQKAKVFIFGREPSVSTFSRVRTPSISKPVMRGETSSYGTAYASR